MTASMTTDGSSIRGDGAGREGWLLSVHEHRTHGAMTASGAADPTRDGTDNAYTAVLRPVSRRKDRFPLVGRSLRRRLLDNTVCGRGEIVDIVLCGAATAARVAIE